MTFKRKIKFAVVGCGHIGSRHIEMIVRNPQAELCALIDSDLEKQDILRNRYPGILVESSLEKYLQTSQLAHVLCIATPNGLHAEHAIQGLDAGMDVVIEKPMALSKNNTQQVIALAQKNNKKVFCVMQNRYSPPSRWLKEVVDSGVLGKIFLVQINCYWNRDKRYYRAGNWHGTKGLDGGTLFTQFSHFIDLMYWVFGDIKNIQSRFKDFNHQDLTQFEDSGLVSFEFLSGGLGCLNFSTSVWETNLESSITIIAENGSIKIGGQYMEKVEHCLIKDYTMPELPSTNPANDYGSYKGSAANHHFIIANVIETLLGITGITTNASEGEMVVDIIERIYKAGNQISKPIS